MPYENGFLERRSPQYANNYIIRIIYSSSIRMHMWAFWSHNYPKNRPGISCLRAYAASRTRRRNKETSEKRRPGARGRRAMDYFTSRFHRRISHKTRSLPGSCSAMKKKGGKEKYMHGKTTRNREETVMSRYP